MELLELIRNGTPALVLGIMLFLERINQKVNAISEDVQEIKNGITWNETCQAKHDEINRRLKALEMNSATRDQSTHSRDGGN